MLIDCLVFKVKCSDLISYGIWYVGESIYIEAKSATFSESSYLEGNYIYMQLEKDCQNGGIFYSLINLIIVFLLSIFLITYVLQVCGKQIVWIY